ncbi:MAG: threonine--tRNA ligase [archaeon]|nr:threonine--tRNA ligase [archaeon]
MNTLFIHADKFKFEAKKETKLAEELSKDLKKKNAKNAIVCFVSIEQADEGKEEAVSKEFAQEIKSVFDQTKAKTVVLYPFVHLLFGKKPSGKETAIKILTQTQKILQEQKIPVIRSPFGWYKSFSIDCKGHPLSELSRVITGEGGTKDESKALEAERKLKSKWFVLFEGKLNELRLDRGEVVGFEFEKHPNLKKFAQYEMAKSRAVTEEPPHVKYMQQLGLAGYEPGSDPGNLRYPPKGKLMKKLIEELTTKRLIEAGAMEIESPIMFDYEHPALKSYLNRFPARQYTIETPNKKVFLRFAACFGQFLLAHDATISYKHMPIWLYELTRYSFRVEQRGELTGLRRLRAFTMPDCHALCADVEQAKQEFLKRYKLSFDLQTDFGLPPKENFEIAVRVVKKFWEENKNFIVNDWLKLWGKPVLLEMWEEQFAYFIFKYEMNFVDALGKAAALTTDQVDTENAARYDIGFINKENKRVFPLILHLSPSGAIERVIYALLEKQFFEEQKGKKPELPLWLSPTQIRLLTVADAFTQDAEKIAKEFEKEGIRVDIDDRAESIGKKIRDAELEWIPFIIVIGEKEKNAKQLMVRLRNSPQKAMSIEEIKKEFAQKTGHLPKQPLPLPKLLTKRPLFVA